MSDGIPEFNEYGCLPEGVYKPTLNEFERRFVFNGQNSTTRKRIYGGFINFERSLIEKGFFNIQWIDGSYVTSKIDPNDIDMVTFYDGLKFGELVGSGAFYQQLMMEVIRDSFSCHSFVVAVYPEGDRRRGFTEKQIAYWKNKWGHNYDGQVKGYIEFELTNQSLQSEIRMRGT